MAAIARIDGYAIVSADGMIADAAGVMPESLKLPADQRFFETALDRSDVMVHGRHSNERQANSPLRLRLVVTRSIGGTATDPSNPRARLWNPAGASLEEALAAVGAWDAVIAVIGGTDVFGLFLDRYDMFHLTRGPTIRLRGGRPVFPSVPRLAPEEVLLEHGLHQTECEVLDTSTNLAVARWRRL